MKLLVYPGIKFARPASIWHLHFLQLPRIDSMGLDLKTTCDIINLVTGSLLDHP